MLKIVFYIINKENFTYYHLYFITYAIIFLNFKKYQFKVTIFQFFAVSNFSVGLVTSPNLYSYVYNRFVIEI
jgi:hypothetical protein